MNWQKEKPNKPCVFISRHKSKLLNGYHYDVWRLMESDGYLGWFTEDGDEYDDYSECNFDEYMIIEELQEVK